jgi:hypothetical protein
MQVRYRLTELDVLVRVGELAGWSTVPWVNDAADDSSAALTAAGKRCLCTNNPACDRETSLVQSVAHSVRVALFAYGRGGQGRAGGAASGACTSSSRVRCYPTARPLVSCQLRSELSRRGGVRRRERLEGCGQD